MCSWFMLSTYSLFYHQSYLVWHYIYWRPMPHISQKILIVKFIIIVLQSNWILPVCLFVCLVVLSFTFNNISVISCQSVLLEETGGPGENHRPVASHWQILSHNVHLALIEIRTHNICGDRNWLHIGSYELNYCMIMPMTAPF